MALVLELSFAFASFFPTFLIALMATFFTTFLFLIALLSTAFDVVSI
jgi:hypothetical protein